MKGFDVYVIPLTFWGPMDDKIIESALRTIRIEKEALDNLEKSIDKQFVKAVKTIYGSKGKVIVTGIGKSGQVAHKIASTLSSTGTPAVYLHPADALHGDLGIISQEDVVIAISNSGETSEILSLIPYVKFVGVPLIAITGNERSTLARKSDILLLVKVEREACPLNLAPTASTTATLVLGDALAIALLELKGFTKEKFARLHPGGLLGRKLKLVKEIMHTGDRVPRVSVNASMRDAILEMTSKGFGATTVVDDEGKLVGIITDGDLRRYIERGNDLNNGRVEDAMTRNPKVISPDSLVGEALNLMEKYKIMVLPVVDDEGRPIGIIHLHDILGSGII